MDGRAHIRVAANRSGRDFFLGDLHGMYDAFMAALAARDFDPARDRVISVGDLVDRGPDSVRCLALLEEPWFHAVRGNHEQMMIDVLLGGNDASLWRLNGGGWFRETEPTALVDLLPRLLPRLPLALTVDLPDGGRIGICHAEYPRPDWDAVESAIGNSADRHRMLWGREILAHALERKVAHVTLSVHGHTPLPAPRRLGNAVFIDTGLVS
ncbi:MAG: metallophosphoesterase, partial [Rhodothalassiaceae bacterium]